MATYPDHILPADVGKFYDAHDVGALAEPLRSRIYTAIHDCPYGLVLVSGHRSPWQQYLLRVGRVGANHAFDSRYPGHPTTALPYHSHHQLGTAADMGGGGLAWLRAHRTDYGIGLTVSGEDWHFEVVGDARVPIRSYPGPEVTEPPTLPPEDIMPIDESTLYQLIAGAVRPVTRLMQIGNDPAELWVTDALTFARKVGPHYKDLLVNDFAVGQVVELPMADAEIIGNIVRTSFELRGKPVPKDFDPAKPATWR